MTLMALKSPLLVFWPKKKACDHPIETSTCCMGSWHAWMRLFPCLFQCYAEDKDSLLVVPL